MSDDFDPYQKWLGIPPEEQPPNHYRLLTLKPFETNVELIGKTATKLVAYLENRAKGKNPDHARRLLAEVTTVRDCLLDADSKADYDAALSPPRARQSTRSPIWKPFCATPSRRAPAPAAGKAVATKTAGQQVAAKKAKAANGRQSVAPAAPEIYSDDLPSVAPLDEPPIDDMSFLDGIHASSPSPVAADFGAAPLGKPAAKGAGKTPAGSFGPESSAPG